MSHPPHPYEYPGPEPEDIIDSLRAQLRETEEKLRVALPDHCYRCEKPCKYAGQERGTGAARCVECLLEQEREEAARLENRLQAVERERDDWKSQADRRRYRARVAIHALREVATLRPDCSMVEDAAEDAAARVTKLEALLRKHGDHETHCNYMLSSAFDCTCGWSEVEAALRQGGESE